jgi:hypothetical protein
MISMRGISRIDYGRGLSWWVRLYRNGEIHHRHFADSHYGGKTKALRAAMAWRDRSERRLPPRQRNAPDARVAPGYGYVKRVDMKRRADVWPVWVAWIRLDGMRAAATSYSIERWGSAGAKRRAQRYLARKRRELAAGGHL